MGSDGRRKKPVKEEEKKRKMMTLAPEENSHKNSAKKIVKRDREVDESIGKKEKKRNKLGGKKKRKTDNKSEDDGVSCQSETQAMIENSAEPQITDKSDKAIKKRKKDLISSKKSDKLIEKSSEAVTDDVYQISSVDEDCSKGMKKWLTEYHQRRPGLEILQQNIDEFIIDHEEREEKARKEREKQQTEGGWTLVEHHKGRKKTTDSESGIAVGSVAQAAVLDKMAKKKSKEVGPDFYRFQRREARMNEVMMLQSKFEQDRKRIQQLRAARKFRPY